MNLQYIYVYILMYACDLKFHNNDNKYPRYNERYENELGEIQVS